MQQKNKKIKTRSALLLDVDYIVKNDTTYVRLLLKAKSTFYLYDKYLPYFYVDCPQEQEQRLLSIKAIYKGQPISPLKIEKVQKIVEGKKKEIYKVYLKHPPHVPPIREVIKDCKKYEYDILFGRRYMIDHGLAPLHKIVYKRVGKRIKQILDVKQTTEKLKILAFDIETYNPHGMPRPQKDPIILISYVFLDQEKNIQETKVISYKKTSLDYAVFVNDEKELINCFFDSIKQLDPDIIVGYNTTNFDVPYLIRRATIYNIPKNLARDGSEIKIEQHGQKKEIVINGRVHVDLYPLLRFFSFIGAVKLSRYTLEAAYEALVGKDKSYQWKKAIDRLEIYKIWDEEKNLEALFEYSLKDSEATLKIAKIILPLEIEISKITKLPLVDCVNAKSSQLVESLLMHHAYKRNEIVPNKPDEQTASYRARNPIEGAFVKTPNPGIYEKIMVFDFRGLYPSIIISHNIDPYTITNESGKEVYQSPVGIKFLKEPKGLIPDVLEQIINTRNKLKDEMKRLDPESEEYKRLWVRQQSLKILANSYYGYLAFARSRYYSRECAQSITAWGRYFINKAIEDAQKNGFEVLYADTDSVFLLLGNKTKEDAIKWMEKLNASLPGAMELELEAYYPRGVFVSKKIEKAAQIAIGAKKKYALIDEKGRIKIRGFELVRRDWSVIAKETQRKVLEAILKEGSKEKAIQIVKEIIKDIREGKVPIEKMAIETQLTKNLQEYEAKSPELVAALKYNKESKAEKLGQGSIIRFVITKTAKISPEIFKECKKLVQAKNPKASANISERAEVLEKAKDYDAEYYIDHQIIPAVLRVLKELGVNKEDLKIGGNQTALFSFED